MSRRRCRADAIRQLQAETGQAFPADQPAALEIVGEPEARDAKLVRIPKLCLVLGSFDQAADAVEHNIGLLPVGRREYPLAQDEPFCGAIGGRQELPQPPRRLRIAVRRGLVGPGPRLRCPAAETVAPSLGICALQAALEPQTQRHGAQAWVGVGEIGEPLGQLCRHGAMLFGGRGSQHSRAQPVVAELQLIALQPHQPGGLQPRGGRIEARLGIADCIGEALDPRAVPPKGQHQGQLPGVGRRLLQPAYDAVGQVGPVGLGQPARIDRQPRRGPAQSPALLHSPRRLHDVKGQPRAVGAQPGDHRVGRLGRAQGLAEQLQAIGVAQLAELDLEHVPSGDEGVGRNVVALGKDQGEIGLAAAGQQRQQQSAHLGRRAAPVVDEESDRQTEPLQPIDDAQQGADQADCALPMPRQLAGFARGQSRRPEPRLGQHCRGRAERLGQGLQARSGIVELVERPRDDLLEGLDDGSERELRLALGIFAHSGEAALGDHIGEQGLGQGRFARAGGPAENHRTGVGVVQRLLQAATILLSADQARAHTGSGACPNR